MPQTILGLAALMLAALLGVSHQQSMTQSYEVRLRDEYAVAGSGLLMHVMELAAARSFDEASTPDKIQAAMSMPDVDDFSVPSAFGASAGTCDLLRAWKTPACDDLDDIHGIEGRRIHLPLPSGDSLAYDIAVEVAYVVDGDITQPTSSQTHHKRVRMVLTAVDRPNLGEIVSLERVISYDPIKAIAEHEAVYGTLPL